jgi:hypothetical protein
MMRRRMGRPGLVGTMARTAVIAGTATAVTGNVAARQQSRAQAAAVPPAAPSEVDEDDILTELTKLGKMHEAGLLSDYEFATAKAKLLGIG